MEMFCRFSAEEGTSTMCLLEQMGSGLRIRAVEHDFNKSYYEPSAFIGHGHPTFNRKSLFHGYINPYCWVDVPIPY